MEEQEPKRRAKDNPWYRLATLHGQPAEAADEIALKNRVAWNRWMASRLSDEIKDSLLKKGWTAEELIPFSDNELQALNFSAVLPENDLIDFSNIEFDVPLFASYFVFAGRTHFINATFTALADFTGATFADAAIFTNATFRLTRFERVIFTGRAHFEKATVAARISFANATFGGRTLFGGAKFADTLFSDATFADVAAFGHATFAGWASFVNVTFAVQAYFGSATFTDAYFGFATFANAFFTGATFAGRVADFKGATFTAIADFVNAEMKSPTNFDEATFARPPECFNTKLHEGTTWHAVRWPETPKEATQARRFLNAYERLKLEMDKLKKHGDELDFFALEQQCRRVVLGPWRGLPIAIYGFLSDYGRSYTRPLALLAATLLIGTVLFAFGRAGCFWVSLLSADCRPAIGLSFASVLSVLGKSLVRPETFLELPDWLKAVSALQSILGLVLLFLFGLGIRNRFRMK